jgi:hypothetical protein
MAENASKNGSKMTVASGQCLIIKRLRTKTLAFESSAICQFRHAGF